ncbi:MAG: ArnT family glycosyltransferase [Anaerolineae bacterium]
MTQSPYCRYMWVALLLIATGLRLTGPDWDGGIAAHPDERFIVGVAQSAPLYGDICAAASDFPYGHLPLAVAQLIALVAPEADPLYAVRLVSGLLGVLIVALAGACGRLLGGRDTALLSGALAAFSPFLIQQAHFYTVDPWAAAFVCGSVLAGARRHWWWAGILLGLGLASKISVAVTLLPLLWSIVRTTGPASETPGEGDDLGEAFRTIATVFAGAIVAFGLASPWALLRPVACWRGPLIQSLMVTGRYEVPYTQQYAGTLPYLYPLVQMALWGLGPLVVPLGALGLAQMVLSGDRPGNHLPWLWTIIFFGVVGATQVKFPRYMLPLYPWWTAWAAHFLTSRQQSRCEGTPWTWLLATASVLATTAFLGLAQVSLYGLPHPWVTASRWLYTNVTAGSTVAVETWEHPLPVPLPEGDHISLEQTFVPVYGEEDDEKRAALDAAGSADVVVVASRRAYGALAQQPRRYEMTLDWYRRLLSTRNVQLFTRCPRVGPLAITDDPLRAAGLVTSPVRIPPLTERCGARWALRLPRLDESYRVYDAPLTLLLLDDLP